MIKFRAWDIQCKEMREVVAIDLYHETYSWILDDYKNMEQSWEDDDIENVVIMQSTGLKDKYGVEIYEGDILYFEPYETHSNDRVVEHIDGAYHGRLIRNGYSKLLAECVYETKVIGNIYENPELLEVAE